MCSLNTTANDPIQGAIEELCSASSALHMFPEPKVPEHEGQEYLVNKDKWAHHAHQHISQALAYLRKVRPEDL